MVSQGQSARPTIDVDEQLGQTGDYGQATVSTTATEVVAADADRQSVLIQNTDASTAAYVGFDSSVTAANGIEVPAGGGTYADDTYAGAVYVIAASGTVDIRYQTVSE